MLHGGFIPRSFAKIVMRESLDAALAAAAAQGYVAADESCATTEGHYNFFESLVSGRDMHDESRPPSDKFRKMFPAQIIKDAAMAHRVATLAAAAPPVDRFLVVMGLGHCGYGHGVPERLFAALPELRNSSYSMYALMADAPLLQPAEADAAAALLADALGGPDVRPADLCVMFSELEQVPSKGAPRLALLGEQVRPVCLPCASVVTRSFVLHLKRPRWVELTHGRAHDLQHTGFESCTPGADGGGP